MIKRRELEEPDSCLNKADFDEPLFVLLGRDASAKVAIQAWVDDRLKTGKNRPHDNQIIEAKLAIEKMEKYREQRSKR